MHELLCQVLNQRDLSKAGDLFSVDDGIIVSDLSDVVGKIREIASQSSYLQNDNDQSVVEICIARVTSAIRETGTIERHAPELVHLLEASLGHNLKPSNRDEDPPHAKIAADVISCIFLNYTKKEVMKLAVPIAVKFLHKGNRELSRNLSSYLSLAALDNADLLALHIQPIIDSVISGNYTLARVLPQIYAVNKEPIHDHVMALVSLLHLCENPEKLSLLSLFGLIAKNVPSLLEPSLPQLCECLVSPVTAMPVLHVFSDMSSFRAQPFAEHLNKMKTTAEQQPATIGLVVRIVGAVGRLNQERARESLVYLVAHLSRVDHASLSGILKEVKAVCEAFPQLLREHIPEISKYSETTASTARMYVHQMKQDYSMQMKSSPVNHHGSGITVVRVNGSKHDLSSSFSPLHHHHPPHHLKKALNGSRSTLPPSSSTVAIGVHGSTTRIGGIGVNTNGLAGINYSMTKLPGSISMNRSVSRLGSSGGIHHASMTRLSSSQAVIHRSVTGNGSRQNIYNSRVMSSGGVTITTNAPSTVTSAKSISGSLSVFREEPSPSPSNMVTVSVTSNSSQTDNKQDSSIESSHSGNAIVMKPSISSSMFPSTNQSSLIFSSPLSSTTSGQQAFVFPSSSKEVSSLPPSTSSRSRTPVSNSNAASITIVPSPTVTPTSPPPSPPPPPFITRAHLGSRSLNQQQRISAFEPYPMRDAVQHFCEKHLDSIKQYMQKVFVKLPLPVKCIIEERKNKKHAKLYFACQGKGEHCLYSRTFFTMKTNCPRIWIHLMFLTLQARSPTALSTREQSVSSLKTCWDILKSDNKTFLTLVFSPFPSAKDQELLICELRNARFFDVFEYNGPIKQWRCFLCNHPDRALGFLQETEPVIEGQLKEKKGKWKFFRRWRTRYFTLSGAHLSYRGSNDKDIQPINVSQIRSVKAISAGRGTRSIPKAFEIFTNDKTYVLKAKDSKNTEQWVQCLSIVVAHSHAKDSGN